MKYYFGLIFQETDLNIFFFSLKIFEIQQPRILRENRTQYPQKIKFWAGIPGKKKLFKKKIKILSRIF